MRRVESSRLASFRPGQVEDVGQTKTRSAKDEPGFMEQMRCDIAREAGPASTVMTVRAEFGFSLRVVAFVVLTRVRRNRLLGET